MKDSLIQQCLDILKKDDVKGELKTFFTPLIEFVFNIINPYIYLMFFIVFLIFIMILAILILLILVLRNKSLVTKTF
jgi:hypothetical protein